MLEPLFFAAVMAASAIALPKGTVALTDDFFVMSNPADLTYMAKPVSRLPQLGAAAACRSQIAKAICVLSPHDQGDVHMAQSHRCEPDNVRYVEFFERVFDRFDPAMQRVFCSVRTLYVQPNLQSIAYASTSWAGGAVVGMRRSVIDAGLDLSATVTYKEQLIFGAHPQDYKPREDLPHLHITTGPGAAQDVAYYILAHEFGHLLDFANGITAACQGLPCEPQSFGELSWRTFGRVAPQSDFPHRAAICYYNCRGGGLPRHAAVALYQGLNASNFITTYSSTNAYEDFAESLAFFLLAQDAQAEAWLDTRQGAIYDLLDKARGPLFAAKAAFVQQLLRRPALSYP